MKQHVHHDAANGIYEYQSGIDARTKAEREAEEAFADAYAEQTTQDIERDARKWMTLDGIDPNTEEPYLTEQDFRRALQRFELGRAEYDKAIARYRLRTDFSTIQHTKAVRVKP